MNIHVSSSPRHLRLTQTMLEDFLWDPVLAASVFWPDAELDVFQRVALKLMWLVPVTMDASGVSTGKTFRNFLYAQLRAMLVPNENSGHSVGVYFPVFGNGKASFWRYYSASFVQTPLFRAQVGRFDQGTETTKKGITSQPDCYYCYFKGGGSVALPAPSMDKDAATQKSRRFNTLILEEFTETDEKGNAIDEELLKRTTAESWQSQHPVWQNHIKYSGHAESSVHASYPRYAQLMREVRKGMPDRAHFAFSYKDYSDLPRKNGKTFQSLREAAEGSLDLAASTSSATKRLCGDFGIWARAGSAFYPPGVLEQAADLGRQMGLMPMLSASL